MTTPERIEKTCIWFKVHGMFWSACTNYAGYSPEIPKNNLCLECCKEIKLGED